MAAKFICPVQKVHLRSVPPLIFQVEVVFPSTLIITQQNICSNRVLVKKEGKWGCSWIFSLPTRLMNRSLLESTVGRGWGCCWCAEFVIGFPVFPHVYLFSLERPYLCRFLYSESVKYTESYNSWLALLWRLYLHLPSSVKLYPWDITNQKAPRFC